jgi:transposase
LEKPGTSPTISPRRSPASFAIHSSPREPCGGVGCELSCRGFVQGLAVKSLIRSKSSVTNTNATEPRPCWPAWRSDKDLYVILDNGSSDRSKQTIPWVAKQERLHLTFTPTHASWLNQIEIWFAILTRKVVRRGIFKSRDELIERQMTFIVAYNQQARPFAWTYTGNPLAV